MIGFALGIVAEMPGLVGQVGLHAQNGLDLGALTRLIEIDDAEHHAVISDRQRIHPQSGGVLCQRLGLAQPIEQGIFSMGVQMHEIGHNASNVILR